MAAELRLGSDEGAAEGADELAGRKDDVLLAGGDHVRQAGDLRGHQRGRRRVEQVAVDEAGMLLRVVHLVQAVANHEV